ncbi:MAG: hypothetical protein M1360_00430 [Candidatus Marsarchaeota archaeon]|jgi:hypothetical protein|nr:hypothetical protein [Candidatus Marsarchaeota archaeon]MCL5418391.1 hypothetical protein [Candidatus Marsarchaeota archaeon]
MAQKTAQHELAKRRVFVFLAVFFFTAMLLDAFSELDVLSHSVDDFGIALIALIVIVYFAVSWKRTEIKELMTQNNVVFVLFAIALILQVYGLFVEAGTNDFGDDIPVLLGLIITLANRFT